MKKQIYFYSLLTASFLTMLVSCGGGGGSGSTPATDTTLSFTGVAAVGAPMANATITVRDAVGATFTGVSGFLCSRRGV